MPASKRAVGNAGEDRAARLLEDRGCRVLCRNFKAARGEIDIIAEKDAFLLFVEVKTRKLGGEHGAAAVDEKKRRRILSAAGAFLKENRDDPYISALTVRFDVVEIAFDRDNVFASCRHIENAFTPDPFFSPETF